MLKSVSRIQAPGGTMGDMVGIRPEAPPDLAAIHAVHLAAFPTDAEARLVDTLRDAGRLTISLVAVVEEGVVGHVAFSPVTVDTIVGGLGLAPIGVLPAFQQRGLGSRLIADGLAHARSLRVPFVVLLGRQPTTRASVSDRRRQSDYVTSTAAGPRSR
jgi:putative acetyltransferase